MPPNEQRPPALDEVRQEIDQIDAQLHALIVRRTDLASHVWSAKRTAPDTVKAALAALRPAREAAMLRALARRHTGAMPLATLWRIWRAFIIANIRVQAPFDVFVGDADNSGEIRDLARGHFGFETAIEAVPDAVAAAGARAGVAVLPMGQNGEWWRALSQGGVRVFAALPQIGQNRDIPQAIAVGDAPIEPTGDDITLVALATDAQNIGDTVTNQGKTWPVVYRVAAPGDTPGETPATIVALAGFLDAAGQAPVTQTWEINNARVEAVILGAYAAPVSELEND